MLSLSFLCRYLYITRLRLEITVQFCALSVSFFHNFYFQFVFISFRIGELKYKKRKTTHHRTQQELYSLSQIQMKEM